MVAIVTGKGAGIEASSSSVLGSSGLLGSASTGRSEESVLLNAATGNLIISDTDEMLVGRGPDAVVSRTYNSLGAWDGDNADYWRAGAYRKVEGLSGTYATTGTTVKRTDWDGSEITYSWTADYYGTGNGAYVATDGGGAYDTLTRSGTTWTWTDGDTQITELYDGSSSGRITARKDADGNTVTYAYDSSTGLMSQITTADGGYTLLQYSGTQLQSLETHLATSTATTTRTFYEYDSYARLSKVIVNLAPSDNSKTTGTNYETTYTYTDTVNKRIASIAQSDGTLVSFTYDGSGRVATITQAVSSGVSRVMTVSYGSGYTTITDNAGQATSVWYDGNNNLTKIVSPPVGASGMPLVKEFDYQSDGDVKWIRDPSGSTVSHVDTPGATDDFDKYGNRRFERDSAGNIVRRTYSTDGRNLLLSDTRYLTPDPDGVGGTAASSPLTTTYLYDSRNHLRYTISPAGRVSEYRYDGFGQRVSAIDYTGSTYTSTLTEAELNAWVAGTVTRSSAQRTDTWYDFRGNVSRTVTYATLDTNGEGTQDPAAITAAPNTTATQQADGLYRVTKTAGSNNSWNAAAQSSVKAVGDFVLQVRPPQNDKVLVAGLSSAPAASASYTDLEYGFYFDFGRPHYMESTSYASFSLSYTAGESFWLVRTGSALNYYRGATLSAAIGNGSLRTVTSSATLYFDSSIYEANASVDVAFTPLDIANGANTTVALQTDGLYRVTKTSGSNVYDADARGKNAATGDFVLQLRPGQTTADMVGGVSTAPGTSSGSSDVLYGFGFSDSTALFYNEGSYYSSLGTYTAGENFWLVRVASTINYYRGATLETAIAAGSLRTVTGVTSTFYFDSALRVVGSKLDALFTPGSITSSAEVSRTDYVYDPSGRLISRAIAGEGVETFAYDGLARVTSSTDMAGLTTSVAFTDATASTTAVTLANGLTQTSTYNRAGELISYTEAGSGVTTAITTYGYDSLGRLRAVTDPTGAANYFFYDAIGRKTAEVDGDGSLTEYRYDANNNLISSTAYATKLTSTQLASLRGTPLAPSNLTNTSVVEQSDGLYRITKTAGGSSSWNADANTTEGVAGDFALQIRIGVSGTAFIVGLSSSASSTGLSGLNQAINFDDNNVSYYYAGSSQAPLASAGGYTYYSAGDTFWMVRSGTDLIIYKGATLATATALRTITGVSGTLYLHTTALYSGAWADVGFAPAVPTLDAIRPSADSTNDRWAWNVYDRAQRLIETIDGTGSVTLNTYDGASQLVSTTQRANLVSGSTLTSMKTAATAPNLWANPNNGGLWNQSNVSRSTAGTINGANAYTFTTSSSGSPGTVTSDTVTVAAGDTVSLSFWAKAGSSSTVIEGLLGGSSTWAGGADSHTVTLSGPGTVTQDSAGYWSVSGLSTSDPTLITMTRTFAAAEGVVAYINVGSTSGNSIVLAKPVMTVVPTAAINVPSADSDNDRASRLFYDGDGRLVGTLDAEGYLTEIIYDGAGRKIRSIAYSGIPTGNLATDGFATLISHVTTDSAKDIRSQWIYDARGLLRATIDGEGTLTRFDYSPAGYLTQQVRGQKVTPTADYTTLASLPSAGSAILETAAWTYNLLGQALTETRTLTGSTTTTTAYTYDSMRRLVSTVTQAGGSDPRTYSQRYDLQGRLKSELSGEGNAWLTANPTQIEAAYANYGWTYAYDTADRLKSKTGPRGETTLYYYNTDGALAYEVNAAGEVVEYRYNAFGERTDTIVYGTRISTSGLTGGLVTSAITSAISANSAIDSTATVAFNVDGTVKQATDPLSNVTTYTYNAFGDISSTSAPLDNDGLSGAARSIITARTYDRRGLLKQEKVDTGGTSPKNLTTTYGYDAFGRAITLTNALSKVTSSTYDRKGRLATTTNALSQTTTYAYDARDNLIAVTDALSNITRFVYDKANRKIATIDALGALTATTYDADGRVVAERAYKNQVSISGLATEVAENNSTFTTALANTNAADQITRYAYDKDGQLRFTVDGLGHAIEHVYDVSGNEIRTVQYDGTITPSTYSTADIATAVGSLASAAGTRTTRAVYDAANRLTYTIDALDALAQVTWFVYDTKGQLIKKTEFAATYPTSGDQSVDTLNTWRGTYANATNDRTTRAYYDRKGQLVYSVDALGFVTKTDYDKLGNVKKQTAYAAASSLTDSTTLATLDSTYTQPTSSSYSDARQTLFEYDSAGRLQATVVYLNFNTTPTVVRTQLVLDALGQITSSTEDYNASDATQGSTTAYIYDDAGRVVKETRASGVSGVETSTWFYYDALGQNTATVDGDRYLSVRTHDAVGQVTAETRYATKIGSSNTIATTTSVPTLQGWAGTSANDIATSASYDAFGRVETATDGRASVVRNAYDVLDQLTSQTEALESTPTDDDRVTYYSYDSFGNAVKVTDPRGNTSYAIFDKLGRVTRQIDAERFVTDTSYTRGGQIASVKRWQVSPNGWQNPSDGTLWSGTGASRTANGTIDGANAYTLAVQTSGTAGYTTETTGTTVVSGNTLTFTFWVKQGSVNFASFGLNGSSSGWGSNGDSTATVLVGPGTLTQTGGGLWSVSGLSTTEASLVMITRTFQTTETASARIYAGTSTSSAVSGNSVVIARPVLGNSDATTSFVYDKNDGLTSTQDAEGFTESYTLNAFGERAGVTNKLGNSTTYTFDKRGLVLTETLPVSTKNSGGSTISVVNSFAYDARGNRTSMVEAYGAVEARATSFTYDKLDRLTGKSGDAVTIVNTDQTSTGSVTPSETYKYDNRGNLIETIVEMGATDARTLTWYDGFSRQIAQADPMGSLTRWAYDAKGNVTSMKRFGDAENMSTLTAASAVPTGGSDLRETTYTYDRSNRLTETKVAELSTGEWNGSNYVIVQGLVSGSPNSAAEIKTSVEYDKAGNAIRQQDGRGNSAYTYHDKLGRAIAQVDAEKYLTVWERDAEGNVIRETRYADQIGSGENVATTTSLATLIGYADDDATNDRVTEFTYDKNGRRTEETRLKVAYTSISSAGVATNVAATDSSAVSKVNYTYNGLGEVLTKTEANIADIAVSTTAREAVSYNYDAIGRLTLETGQSFTDSAGSTVTPRTAYTYDGLNNLKATRVQKGSTANDTDDRITSYTYGAGGRLATMTDAAGNTRTYGYDLAGRTVRESYARLKSDGSTSVTEAQVTRYDLAGRVVTQTFARYTGSAWVFTDGIGGTGNYYDAVRISYNGFGEISGRGLTAGPDATAVYQESFSYDAGGRLWKSNTGDGVLRFHVYDKAGNETLTLVSTGADLSTLTVSNYTASIGSTGDTSTGDAVTTLTVYDKRGQATATYEPDRQLSSSSTGNTIDRARAYNAFGEVKSETDARSFVTTFTYNTMGRMLSKVSPQVSTTAENGTITTTATPTDYYGYDLAGRLVAVSDANTNTTRRLLLAGTGHSDAEALVTKEFHPDTGVFETKYDVFGDARILRNELYTGSNATATDEVQTFDKMGRLLTVQHRGNLLTDTYGYDSLGQRTTHYNSQLGSGVKETTDYDTKGRVTAAVAMGGDTTGYAYAWGGSLATAGLGTFGGWTKTTTNAAGKSMTEVQDYFGHTVDKVDFGGLDYAFGFDRGGRLHTRTNAQGEDITYNWYNTGLAASVASAFTGDTYYGQTATNSYAYDASGNRTLEKYEVSGHNTTYQGGASTYTYSISHQTAVATYDAMNRVLTIADTTSASGSAPMSIAYEYDAVGNIRRAKAEYRSLDEQGAVSSSAGTQDNWYRYDNMNRFVVSMGLLKNGSAEGDAARGSGATISGGKRVAYDLTGRRQSVTTDATNLTKTGWKFTPTSPGAVRWYNSYEDVGGGTMVQATFTYSGERRETYTYTDAGFLASVAVNGTTAVFHGAGNPNITYTAISGSAGTTRAVYTTDAMGRVELVQEYDTTGTSVIYERDATYNDKSQLVTDKVTSAYGDTLEGTTTYYYNASETSSGSGLWDGVTSGGSYMGGAVTRTATVNKKNGTDSAAADTSMVYRLSWRDGTVQRKTTYDGDTGSGSNALWVSDFRYDASGNYVSVAIDDDRDRTVTFATGADGLILQRDETDLLSTGDPRELHYYFAGQRIGDTGNDGTSDVDYVQSIAEHVTPQGTGPFRNGQAWYYTTPRADFDQSYDPINGFNYASTASSYTVQAGDTLASVALAVWGDASLWYLLAEANGLTPSSALSPGASLTIPNKVHNNHNNTSTWRPYDPNRAVGDVSPTAAKAPKKAGGCGAMGQILMVVVAVAVTAWLTGPLSTAIGAMLNGGTAAAGSAAAIGGGVIGGAMAGAAGSIASQGFGLLTGNQSGGFNWKAVGLSAIAGGISGGIGAMKLDANAMIRSEIDTLRGATSKFDSVVASVGRVLTTGGAAGGALRSVVTNIATQGVGQLTGLQDTFDWVGVAAAGVGGGVTGGIGLGGMQGAVVRGMAGGIANATARSLITGTSFGDNLIAALPDVIGSTLGNLVIESSNNAAILRNKNIEAKSQPLKSATVDACFAADALGGAYSQDPTSDDEEPKQIDGVTIEFAEQGKGTPWPNYISIILQEHYDNSGIIFQGFADNVGGFDKLAPMVRMQIMQSGALPSTYSQILRETGQPGNIKFADALDNLDWSLNFLNIFYKDYIKPVGDFFHDALISYGADQATKYNPELRNDQSFQAVGQQARRRTADRVTRLVSGPIDTAVIVVRARLGDPAAAEAFGNTVVNSAPARLLRADPVRNEREFAHAAVGSTVDLIGLRSTLTVARNILPETPPGTSPLTAPLRDTPETTLGDIGPVASGNTPTLGRNPSAPTIVSGGTTIPVAVRKAAPAPIQTGEITTYADFSRRSLPKDGIAGHEIWQHANLKANGLATQRHSTDASRNNPVIALDNATHNKITMAQRAFNSRTQTPIENINANIQLVKNHTSISDADTLRLHNMAIEHARKYGF